MYPIACSQVIKIDLLFRPMRPKLFTALPSEPAVSLAVHPVLMVSIDIIPQKNRFVRIFSPKYRHIICDEISA
jgi:hypothetical protein